MTPRIALALALAGAVPAAPAQTCNPQIRASAPAARFSVNAAKGTVLDQRTGLTWKRCAEGLSGNDCGAGAAARMNWGGALRRAAASTHAGYTDWRVPNSKELESLVEVACNDPAINDTVFLNDPSTDVWASSPYADSTNDAWIVGFFIGGPSFHGSRNNNYAVRLVRGGQ